MSQFQLVSSLRGVALLALIAAAVASRTLAGCAVGDRIPVGGAAEGRPSGAGGMSGANGAGAGQGEGNSFAITGAGPCTGLECQQVECDAGAKTSVSGTVFDPAGAVPLYNVIVYVPNAALEPVPEGVSCDKCGATLSGAPLVSALSDTHGKFILEDVPAGENIPLVIQVGKWRREVTIPSVAPCVENPINDSELTRLPRNQSEGSMPQIALSTGGADALECLIRKIGVDDAEFTTDAGNGRVHLFSGWGGSAKLADVLGGAPLSISSQALWADLDTLKKYDVVLLSCEGTQNKTAKTASARQALFDYTAQGGRVFASHWHNYWLEEGPDPFPKTAVFNHQKDLPSPLTALIDTSFPKGQALADWLVNVGASSVLGELVLKAGQHTVDAVDPAISRRWIYSQAPESVQYFTFNTPIGVAEAEQCGRVVFSDIHVASGDTYGADFPLGCVSKQISPQEMTLLFMLFDLTACIQSDDKEPIDPL